MTDDIFTKITQMINSFQQAVKIVFEVISKASKILNDNKIVAEKFSNITYELKWFYCCPLSIAPDLIDNVIEYYDQNQNSPDLQIGIDNLFYEFYDNQLDDILDDIKQKDTNSARVELIEQAFRAYRDEKYFITIAPLFSAFESLVYEKAENPHWVNQKRIIQEIERLGENKKSLLLYVTTSKYMEQVKELVYKDIPYGIKIPIDGIPYRNMIMHGLQFDYATKKTALNTIIMLYTIYYLAM